MVPQPTPLFSPSELAYLQSSLILDPPIRPDGRPPTTFRPLSAETDFLPSANGSARLCFADGTEAIVGVKAEVQKSRLFVSQKGLQDEGGEAMEVELERGGAGPGAEGEDARKTNVGEDSWVEVTIDIPGQRDDDNMVVFLSQMIHEGLVADGVLEKRLWINNNWHWKLYVDILLLSPPLSYPLPLLSLTTHLALLTSYLPALVSKGDEDPLFNDDWAAAIPLYPQQSTSTVSSSSSPPSSRSSNDISVPAQPQQTPNAGTKPPITLLLTSHGPQTILFDPSASELAVADAVLAITITSTPSSPSSSSSSTNTTPASSTIQILSIRTLDPPSRSLCASDTSPDSGGLQEEEAEQEPEEQGGEERGAGEDGVWRASRGGVGRGVLKKMVGECTQKGGVGEEVLRGLEGWAAAAG